MINIGTKPCNYCGELKEEILRGSWGFIVCCDTCGKVKIKELNEKEEGSVEKKPSNNL